MTGSPRTADVLEAFVDGLRGAPWETGAPLAQLVNRTGTDLRWCHQGNLTWSECTTAD